MIDKLLNVVIVVSDQEKAVDFYTRALGLEKRTDFTPPGGSRWVTVAPKGQDIEISLFQAGSVSDPKAPQNQLQPGKNAQWALRTTDCRKDFEEMKSRGVKFNEEQPVQYPWGVLATFRDPDGNPFSLLQQPSSNSWENKS
jgi:catechol 2,3-dioxygenase-like lactoylglutathione lyase family enzyme